MGVAGAAAGGFGVGVGVEREEVIESPRGAGGAVRSLAVAAPPSKPTIHMSQVDFIKRRRRCAGSGQDGIRLWSEGGLPVGIQH